MRDTTVYRLVEMRVGSVIGFPQRSARQHMYSGTAQLVSRPVMGRGDTDRLNCWVCEPTVCPPSMSPEERGRSVLYVEDKKSRHTGTTTRLTDNSNGYWYVFSDSA